MEEETYSCGLCDFKSSRLEHLKYHMRIHSLEKPFRCEICVFRSSTFCGLLSHSRSHAEGKSYRYNLCDYKNHEDGNLVRYGLAHIPEKPYRCKHCSYKSSRFDYFKSHMRHHPTDKFYVCEICNFRSSYWEAQYNHVSTHIGKNPYMCDYCLFHCTTKCGLKHHIVTSHVSIINEKPVRTCQRPSSSTAELRKSAPVEQYHIDYHSKTNDDVVCTIKDLEFDELLTEYNASQGASSSTSEELVYTITEEKLDGLLQVEDCEYDRSNISNVAGCVESGKQYSHLLAQGNFTSVANSSDASDCLSGIEKPDSLSKNEICDDALSKNGIGNDALSKNGIGNDALSKNGICVDSLLSNSSSSDFIIKEETPESPRPIGNDVHCQESSDDDPLSFDEYDKSVVSKVEACTGDPLHGGDAGCVIKDEKPESPLQIIDDDHYTLPNNDPSCLIKVEKQESHLHVIEYDPYFRPLPCTNAVE